MRRTAVRAAAALDRLLAGLTATILAVLRAVVFAATLALAVGGAVIILEDREVWAALAPTVGGMDRIRELAAL
jgi:hypothetical protein